MSASDAVPVLQRLIPGLAAVYVFGSEAPGDARADSDLDLAIVRRPQAAALDIHAVREAVELALGRGVDLVDVLLAKAQTFERCVARAFAAFVAIT